ncbi:MAG: methyl-accepting chemotaxis protein [Sporolactobacillus sp.]
MSINQRYLVNIGLVFAMMTASVILSALFLVQASEAVNVVGAAGRHIDDITEIGAMFRIKDSRIADYVVDPGDRTINAYTADQRPLTLAEQKLQQEVQTPQQKDLVMQIMRTDSQMYNLFQNEFIPATLMGEHANILHLRDEQNTFQQQTVKTIGELRNSIVAEQQQAVNNAHIKIFLAIGSGFFSLLTAIAICMVITLRIQTRVRYSMKQVMAVTGKMAEGNLAIGAVNINRHDEIGKIGYAVIQLNHYLKDMIGAIGQLTGTTKKSSKTLAGSVEVVTDHTLQVQETLKELSAGIRQQALQMEQVSEQVDSFTDRLTKEAKKTGHVLLLTQVAIADTHSGQEAMERSVALITGIEKAAAASVEKLKRLETNVGRISESTVSIEKIAKQTKLLALNASIEAARSQSDQDGFSVISVSIRQLADRTAVLTKQIVELIANVSFETMNVRRSLVENFNKAEAGLVQIQQTKTQFEHIRTQTLQIGEEMTLMNSSFQTVTQIGVAIGQAVEDIVAIFEQTSAGISEISQSNEGISTTVQNFSEDAKQMADQSNALEKLVNRFSF